MAISMCSGNMTDSNKLGTDHSRKPERKEAGNRDEKHRQKQKLEILETGNRDGDIKDWK